MSMSFSPADSHELIRVTGARQNNLKNVSVELPKRRLTVFTGVSGSGKSSLVFGTIGISLRVQYFLIPGASVPVPSPRPDVAPFLIAPP